MPNRRSDIKAGRRSKKRADSRWAKMLDRKQNFRVPRLRNADRITDRMVN